MHLVDTAFHRVDAHYAHQDLEATILDALVAAGKDPDCLKAEDLAPIDEFHVRGRKATFDLARDFHFDVVDYEQIGANDWVTFPASHWPQGFSLPRLVVDAGYNVSTCCLKTHGFGGVFTMSLKLSVGLTPKRLRGTMHRSRDMRRMIAELNTGYKPNLIVLDGVAAFTDGGPSRGELKAGNVMIAGDDRIAVDAVGLAVANAAIVPCNGSGSITVPSTWMPSSFASRRAVSSAASLGTRMISS